jgi:HEPN domain-containing protein
MILDYVGAKMNDQDMSKMLDEITRHADEPVTRDEAREAALTAANVLEWVEERLLQHEPQAPTDDGA